MSRTIGAVAGQLDKSVDVVLANALYEGGELAFQTGERSGLQTHIATTESA
jgi:hypothetical protein